MTDEQKRIATLLARRFALREDGSYPAGVTTLGTAGYRVVTGTGWEFTLWCMCGRWVVEPPHVTPSNDLGDIVERLAEHIRECVHRNADSCYGRKTDDVLTKPLPDARREIMRPPVEPAIAELRAMVYDFLMDDIDGMVDNLGVSAGTIRTALAVLKPDS